LYYGAFAMLHLMFNPTTKESPDMPRAKSTEIYSVTVPGLKPLYVEAQGKQEARATVVRTIKIDKLSGRELRDVIGSGARIIDGSEANLGDDVPTDPTTAGQQSLPVE
jgi:hypothetical protein